jgi:transposase
MKVVELYGRVRFAVQREGLSNREVARRFGIDPRTVAKMLLFSVPPGYRRRRPPKRPKLNPFIGIIDQILEDDKSRPLKQRHTLQRIFERLRDEHCYAGGLTIVKDYVVERRQRLSERGGKQCGTARGVQKVIDQRLPCLRAFPFNGMRKKTVFILRSK